MSFLDKVRAALMRFMAGRYGADQLSFAMVVLSLAVTLIGALLRIPLLTLMADALLIVTFVRMLSKDRVRRAQENQLYLQKTQTLRREASEWIVRMKNGKKYRYFVCPKCKARLRVPRGVGTVTITCRSCGNRFDKKA